MPRGESPSDGATNGLLAVLPPADYGRLRSALEPVTLRYRQVLYEPGETITHVYFPTAAVVSLLIPLEDGTSVETLLVGDDGLVGLPVAFGSERDTNRALVQIAGPALRLTAADFRAALGQGDALRKVVHRYTQVVLVQTAQGAFCNRLHSMSGRCARWMLETHDRVHADEFPLTQDFLGSMLAMRRATVSAAAGMLQQAGLIRYHRGHVTILRREGLEAAACECYRAVTDVASRLLGRSTGPQPEVSAPRAAVGTPAEPHDGGSSGAAVCVKPSLAGKVAVVTGGSRGVGKGVALGLGEAGATVYVTGRTVSRGDTRLPGTIVETAEAVTRLGGCGIAVRCDHRNDAEVEAVFRRVHEEQGRLDILVNNVIAFPEGGFPRDIPFWQLPIALWDDLLTVGLRSHYVASVFAAPIMVAQRRGLIVNISSRAATGYLANVAYGVGKAGVDRLAADMAHELRPYNVAVVSLWPWLVRTEWLMAEPERNPRTVAYGSSPQFTGRAVAALAADPEVMDKTGRTLVAPQLGEEYGFTDVDGTRPRSVPDSVISSYRSLPRRGRGGKVPRSRS